jgi:pimeloyl-ACP methyl ester carboxylesterase
VNIYNIDIHGQALSFLSIGTGDPVLFIHAYGLSPNSYLDFIAGLQEGRRFIVPYLPGIGPSSPLAAYGMDKIATHLDALREHLGIYSWDIIGHSIGGYIGVEMLSKYPDTIGRMLFLHSFCFPDSAEKAASRTKQIEFVQNHGVMPLMKETIMKLFSAEYQNKNVKSFEKILLDARTFQPEGVSGLLQAMRDRQDHSTTISHTDKWIGFILSENDQAIPLDKSLEQLKLPRRSIVHFINDATHMSPFESPEKSSAAINDFLNTKD